MKITIAVLMLFALITITITGFWDFVSQNILPNTSWGLYNKSFFENLLAGMHGSIIDLFLIGIVIFWFDKHRERKNNIEDLNEYLGDLQYYNGTDISFKYLKTIKN